jgi:hypothetical protein
LHDLILVYWVLRETFSRNAAIFQTALIKN